MKKILPQENRRVRDLRRAHAKEIAAMVERENQARMAAGQRVEQRLLEAEQRGYMAGHEQGLSVEKPVETLSAILDRLKGNAEALSRLLGE